MTCDPHDWKPTGKQGVHVEFPTVNKGVRTVYAIYLRCRRCGQIGFRRPGYGKVIYTWSAESVA